MPTTEPTGFILCLRGNVLLDGVVAIGASDVIYGPIHEYHCIAQPSGLNVAGLEIEKPFRGCLQQCLTDNTGGICLDLPDIPQQGGHHVRVFNNRSLANNTTNFAPEGNIVGLCWNRSIDHGKQRCRSV